MSTEGIHFPSTNAKSTQITKEEIVFLENQLASAQAALEEAQRLVTSLKKTLGERRASIAPIRLLPIEILSLILEICALDDWRSPLRIACVSRQLRNAVLNTPRAWCTILAGSRTVERTDIYFERSGQCKIHIGLTTHISFPERVVCRVKCMSTRNLGSADISTAFSSLERLCVQNFDSSFKTAQMTATSFPSLRHLDLSNVITCSNAGVGPLLPPPLESLGLRVNEDDHAWLAMIQGCNASLRSLCLLVDSYYLTNATTQIDLPALHHLKIIYCSLKYLDFSWLSVNAPSLRVYIDLCEDPSNRCLLTNGWQEITHLRLDGPPPLSELKDVCSLQLRSGINEIGEFLQELEAGTVILHHLKSLEFSDYWIEDEEKEETVQVLNDLVSTHYLGLRPLLVSEPWATGPHWDLVHPVR